MCTRIEKSIPVFRDLANPIPVFRDLANPIPVVIFFSNMVYFGCRFPARFLLLSLHIITCLFMANVTLALTCKEYNNNVAL